MPILSCKICSEEFYIKPAHLKRWDGKYCSNACAGQGRRTGKFLICTTCGKDVWRTPRHLRISKSGKYFCNKSCQTHWRNSVVYVGSNHPNWKGGEFVYRNLLSKTATEKKCKRCGIIDFRLLTVHHTDWNHQNNKLNNLIWLCYNCHALVHKDKAENKKFMEAIVKQLSQLSVAVRSRVQIPLASQQKIKSP